MSLVKLYYQAVKGELAPFKAALPTADFSSSDGQMIVNSSVRGKLNPASKLVLQHIDPEMKLADKSVLYQAVYCSSLAAVKMLITQGAHVSEAVFDKGIYDKPIFNFLLDHVAPNADWKKPPLVRVASMYNGPSLNNVLQLLDRGADPSQHQRNGESALQLVMQENPDAAVLLIERGAKVDAVDSDGETALFLAAAYHTAKSKVLPLLLSKGANPNHASNEGSTPLHSARSDSAVKALLEAGADTQSTFQGPYGSVSVLESVIGYITADVARQIISKGSSYENLLQDLASSSNADPNNVAVLLAHGDALENTNSRGYTALHCAAWHLNPVIGNALLDAGALVSATNDPGKTPIEEWLEKIDNSTPAMLAFGERMLTMLDSIPANIQKKVDRFKVKLAKQREKIATFNWEKLEEWLFKATKKRITKFGKENKGTLPDFAAFCFDCNLDEGAIGLCFASGEEHSNQQLPSPGNWRYQFAVLDRHTEKSLNTQLSKLELNGMLEEDACQSLLDSICRVAVRLQATNGFEKMPLLSTFEVCTIEHNETSKSAKERMNRVAMEKP